jgi:hypothetical protein
MTKYEYLVVVFFENNKNEKDAHQKGPPGGPEGLPGVQSQRPGVQKAPPGNSRELFYGKR